jgi:alginate O-acetyltransferase complex protein AlgI
MGARPGLKSRSDISSAGSVWTGLRFSTGSQCSQTIRREWLSLLRPRRPRLFFFLIARLFYPQHTLTAGYIGLAGFLLFTFFGTFHILSLYWRRRGVNAVPMMNSPLRPSSLSDFWSSRWNLAFRDIARAFVFRPVLRRWGVVYAVIAAFVFSGVLHELLISLPADAWYGLPTLFFLIQAGGVFIEKSGSGVKAGINRGRRGWVFAAAFILLPVVLLFHPALDRNCMLPFMKALRALQ